jgi:hypothetical protein
MSRNGAKIDLAQSKFGGASALYQGTLGQWIQTPDSADWDFGAGDFTIDLQVYFTSVSAQTTFACQWSSSGGGAWLFRRIVSGGSRLQLDYRNTGGTASSVSAAWTPATGTWYHVAVVRTGNVVKFFVNGTQVGSDQPLTATLFNSSSTLSIGDYSDGDITSHDGWFDEIRISKGIARWTANFLPPTAAYSVSPVYTDTPSGGLVLGGFNTSARATDIARTGGIVLGGSASQNLAQTLSRSGGIILGGDATTVINVRLTVRLFSGGVEVASWTHPLTGSQARVSWTQLQLPLSGVPVTKVVVGKPKLMLKAKPVTTEYAFALVVQKPKLILKGKHFSAIEPDRVRPEKPALVLKGKSFVLRTTAKPVVGKPKLILRAKAVARAGQAGLIPSPPRILILTPTEPKAGNLVPTASKTTLLVPTTRRSV